MWHQRKRKKLRKQENKNNNYDDDTEELKNEIMETFLCPHLHVLFKTLDTQWSEQSKFESVLKDRLLV